MVDLLAFLRKSEIIRLNISLGPSAKSNPIIGTVKPGSRICDIYPIRKI